jgi:hypothetical protein
MVAFLTASAPVLARCHGRTELAAA